MSLVRSPGPAPARAVVIDPDGDMYARARSADAAYNRRRELEMKMERDRDRDRDRDLDRDPLRIMDRDRDVNREPLRIMDGDGDGDERDYKARGHVPRPYWEDAVNQSDDDEAFDRHHRSDASSDDGIRIIPLLEPRVRGRSPPSPSRHRRATSPEQAEAFARSTTPTFVRTRTPQPWRHSKPPRAVPVRRDADADADPEWESEMREMRQKREKRRWDRELREMVERMEREQERDRDRREMLERRELERLRDREMREKRRRLAQRIPHFFDDEDEDDSRPWFYHRDSHPRRGRGNYGEQYAMPPPPPPPPGIPDYTGDRRHHRPDPYPRADQYPGYQQYPPRPANGYYSVHPQRPQPAPNPNMPYAGASTTPFDDPGYSQYPQPGPPDLDAYPRERATMPQMPMPGPPDLNAYPRDRRVHHQQPMSVPTDPYSHRHERGMDRPPPMPMPGPPDLSSYTYERAAPRPQPPPPARPPAREPPYAEPRAYSPDPEAAAMRRETDRLFDFEAKMRREMEELFANAAEAQRLRNEKTEAWARKEVERRQLFEEAIQGEVASATTAIRTIDEEQGAKVEEARRLKALAEELMQRSQEALNEAKRLRNEFHVTEVDQEEVYAPALAPLALATPAPPPSPPPPPPPASPPSSSTDHHRGRRQSSSPPWGPTSPASEVPEPLETEADEIKGPEKDDEGEVPRRGQQSSQRRSSSSVDSLGTFSSASYHERDEVKRRELRRVREELLDPILDTISALTKALVLGGSHFNVPPVFMHYPPRSHTSDGSRSCSSCSESDDRETVTPKHEEPVQRSGAKEEQNPRRESRASVVVPGLYTQESSFAEVAPSGTSSEYVLGDVDKEDGTDETPTLINFESVDHTAVGTKTPFQTERPLNSEKEGESRKNQQTADHKVTEHHPRESSGIPSKEVLLSVNDIDAESEVVTNTTPQPSTSSKRPKHQKASDSRHRDWDGSYAPKKRYPADLEGQGRKERHDYEKAASIPVLQPAFIPIPYFHPVFGGVPPSRSRRRRGGDEEHIVD